MLWRELQRDDDTAEEALWALNPGLAEFGPVLPSGVVVTLPELDRKQEAARAVTVWD
ncbi:Phage Tail Protein X [compost metagenome]